VDNIKMDLGVIGWDGMDWIGVIITKRGRKYCGKRRKKENGAYHENQ
jgi:hypothetical protein